MKRLAFLLAAVVLFTPACDDDDPVDPSAAAPAQIYSGPESLERGAAGHQRRSGATGTMNLTVNVTRDSSNNITAVSSSEFVVNMAGFPAGHRC